MTQGSVRKIRDDLVTVDDVMEDLNADRTKLKEIYVVGIEADDGRPVVWAAGSLKGMALAAMHFHAKCTDALRESASDGEGDA